jgi:hypothetical protein
MNGDEYDPCLRSEATARKARDNDATARQAEKPVLEWALAVEIIIIAVALFAAGWCVWDDWQVHKAHKEIQKIEQRQ